MNRQPAKGGEEKERKKRELYKASTLALSQKKVLIDY